MAEGLINSCFDWAQSQGVVMAKLAVITDNQSAICCYERCGFEVYGTEPKVIYYDGTYYDEVLMAKPVTINDIIDE